MSGASSAARWTTRAAGAGASLWERRTTAQNTDRYRLLGGSYDFKVARAALAVHPRR
jgi:hypothetical protein